ACAVALARCGLLLLARATRCEHLVRLLARDDDDAVVVGDDDVPWLDRPTGADDADVHVAQCLLHGAERRHALRPDGEGHSPELGEWPSQSEEHTSELQSLAYLVCRLLLEKKKHRI